MATGSLGDRIRALRVSIGLTHAALGAKIGVAASTIQGWESDRRTVRPIYIKALAQAFGVPLSSLGIADEPVPPAPLPPTALSRLRAGILEVLEGAIEAEVLTAEEVGARLRSMTVRSPAVVPLPSDLLSQAAAASTLGVSRQAIHRLVAEGRVKGYPNPERPDRAPMVSLAEVRALVLRRPAPAAAEPVAADPAAQPSPSSDETEPLHSGTQDDDTQAGVIPVSPDPTTPPDVSGEVPADPPWFADEVLIEDWETTSAAFTGQRFRDRPKREREFLVQDMREALRAAWRRETPERRAELLEKWRRSHP